LIKPLLLPLLVFSYLYSGAQLPDKLIPVDSTQTDLIDVAKNIFKKGTPRRVDTIINKKGKTHFSLLPAAGYTLQTGFAGVISGNAAFFINEHNHAQENVSTVVASIAYTSRNQTILPVESSIWTKSNKYNIVTDWRYLQYPSETFGLGGHSSMDNEYTLNFSYLKLHQAVLKKLAKEFYAGLGYDLDYFWKIQEVDPPAGRPTDFENYGLHPKEKASGVSLNFLYDSRRNPINPQKGLFANIILRPKFVFLGSDANWQTLLLEFRTYRRFPSGSGNILAFWSYNWLTLGGTPPYLLLPSTAWDEFSNTGRGYIQGRFRSRNMLDQEGEYRFGITANGLLGGVVFVTTQSFSDLNSNRFEVISPGAGLGIRVKLNKFSGTNVALDYAFGTQGSKGFFVNLGEVF
jgi:hypothetical protein